MSYIYDVRQKSFVLRSGHPKGVKTLRTQDTLDLVATCNVQLSYHSSSNCFHYCVGGRCCLCM